MSNFAAENTKTSKSAVGKVQAAEGVRDAFAITGPDQTQRQSGTDLVKNASFKNEFAKFLMGEWTQSHNGQIIGTKTLVVSHNGTCKVMKNDGDTLLVTSPNHLQRQHEEADTLVA